MDNEKIDKDGIFHNYLIAIHQLEKEYNLPKEKLTMNKELMKLVEKLAKVEFKQNEKQIARYTKEIKDVINKIKN